MIELYQKLDELKTTLDSLPVFVELEQLIQQINHNQSLVNKIKTYHEHPTIELKNEINYHPLVMDYKRKENEVNFLILQINQKLNSIRDKGSCHHENH